MRCAGLCPEHLFQQRRSGLSLVCDTCGGMRDSLIIWDYRSVTSYQAAAPDPEAGHARGRAGGAARQGERGGCRSRLPHGLYREFSLGGAERLAMEVEDCPFPAVSCISPLPRHEPASPRAGAELFRALRRAGRCWEVGYAGRVPIPSDVFCH